VANAKTQTELLKSLSCPITRSTFKKPVVAADGYTYERKKIVAYFEGKTPPFSSPMNREVMEQIDSTSLVENKAIKETIKAFDEDRQEYFTVLTYDGKTYKIPRSFYCPLSKRIFFKPMIDPDGITYEEEVYTKEFNKKRKEAEKEKPGKTIQMPKLLENKTLFSAIQEFFDRNPVLRFSEQLYFSKMMVSLVRQAIALTDRSETEKKELVDEAFCKDPRLLFWPLGKEKKTALTLTVQYCSLTLLDFVIKKLGDKLSLQPELKLNQGDDFFNLVAKNIGKEGVLLLAKALGWKEEQYQKYLAVKKDPPSIDVYEPKTKTDLMARSEIVFKRLFRALNQCEKSHDQISSSSDSNANSNPNPNSKTN
jgi:hypothetical protein